MIRAGTPTAQAWAAQHGCQSLVHWAGPPSAPQKQDACTYGLAGLSVPRFFAFLSLFHPDHLHGADATGGAAATKRAPFAPPKHAVCAAQTRRLRRQTRHLHRLCCLRCRFGYV